MMQILNQSFYNRNAIRLAPELLGKVLVRNLNGQIISGRIVEVEAYLANQDEAAHAFKGETKRNKSLFSKPGNSYIYSIHTHFCLDVVAEVPTSVLIRALEPIDGIDKMKELRNLSAEALAKADEKSLTSGPGKLCKALGITKELDGIDLTSEKSEIYIMDDGFKLPESKIIKTKRVGISKAKEFDYRFYIKENKFVSRKS
ncbi:MAG: DNA-3-methyladenine glycosylase [Candidatus Dojkabacteria bacterium]